MVAIDGEVGVVVLARGERHKGARWRHVARVGAGAAMAAREEELLLVYFLIDVVTYPLFL